MTRPRTLSLQLLLCEPETRLPQNPITLFTPKFCIPLYKLIIIFDSLTILPLIVYKTLTQCLPETVRSRPTTTRFFRKDSRTMYTSLGVLLTLIRFLSDLILIVSSVVYVFTVSLFLLLGQFFDFQEIPTSCRLFLLLSSFTLIFPRVPILLHLSLRPVYVNKHSNFPISVSRCTGQNM